MEQQGPNSASSVPGTWAAASPRKSPRRATGSCSWIWTRRRCTVDWNQSASAGQGRGTPHLPQVQADDFPRVRPLASWRPARIARLIIEAIFEDLEIKKKLFVQLDQLCAPQIRLATNTSSFLVRHLAAVTREPPASSGCTSSTTRRRTAWWRSSATTAPRRSTEAWRLWRPSARRRSIPPTPRLRGQPLLRAVAQRGGPPARGRRPASPPSRPLKAPSGSAWGRSS